MAHYQTSFTSPTSPEVAFDYLSRFSTTAEWDPGVVEARDLTPDPVGVGSAFEVVSSFLGRRVPLRYEVVEYDAPRRVVLRAENSSVRSTDTITFEAGADGATVVSYDAVLEPRGPARVMAPLFTLLFRRIGDRAARGLREHVDHLAGADLGDTGQPA
ncbi:MAG TPA: SRPBCC family protein [Acidimicrobiales bacterium]|nr:SRPBCC family protein [Acidimicrobiales bacterium]